VEHVPNGERELPWWSRAEKRRGVDVYVYKNRCTLRFGLLRHSKHLPLLFSSSSSSSSSSTIIISIDGKSQAGTVEHVAAGLDSNVARSHSVVDDSGQKQTLSEHVEDKPSDEPLNAIAMLNDPDFAAKEKAPVRHLDMTFIPCLWILYFHDYLYSNNIT
jgi:hypothetical protein